MKIKTIDFLKKIKLVMSCFFCSLLVISCVEKTNFTDEDLIWIDIYNEGDILIFQELEFSELDTTLITRKEIYHPGYQPMARENIPHTARLFYKNKKYTSPDFDAEMIEMYKNESDEEAKPIISYLGGSFFTEDYSLDFSKMNLNITTKEFNNVYIFSNIKHKRHTKDQDANPQVLYWDKYHGIIKYITYEGKVWERINW